MVQAKIPAASTRQGMYDITMYIRPSGSEILDAFCTCPVSRKCKHIHKVLKRVEQSVQNPIPGPGLAARARRRAEAQRRADMLEHASVYIAFTCKSEVDSGSDFRRSMYAKESFEQEILGVFFSKQQANQCAKNYVEENFEEEEEEEQEEEEYEFDDDESFVWEDENCEGMEFDKVWVERRAIEDASPRFRK